MQFTPALGMSSSSFRLGRLKQGNELDGLPSSFSLMHAYSYRLVPTGTHFNVEPGGVSPCESLDMMDNHPIDVPVLMPD